MYRRDLLIVIRDHGQFRLANARCKAHRAGEPRIPMFTVEIFRHHMLDLTERTFVVYADLWAVLREEPGWEDPVDWTKRPVSSLCPRLVESRVFFA